MPQMILGWFDGEWYEVRTEEQARLLSDPEARRLLTPFIGFERSATQASRELGCSLERLLYRLKQFKRAGLLRETRSERRAGRPVRFYRAVADGFHVPFELTPFEDVEALIARQHELYDRLRDRAGARHVRQQSRYGRRIYRDTTTGELHTETALLPDETLTELAERTATTDFEAVVRLEPRQAREIGQELRDLYERVQAARLPDGHGQAFLLRACVISLAPEDL